MRSTTLTPRRALARERRTPVRAPAAAPVPRLGRPPVSPTRIELPLTVATAAASDAAAAAVPVPPLPSTAGRAARVAATAAVLAAVAYTASPGGAPALSTLAAAAGVVGAKLAGERERERGGMRRRTCLVVRRGTPPPPHHLVPHTHTPSLAVTSAVAKSAWAGLAAGCLHTLSGPDHLAALTPLTVGRSHTAAALLGGLWGFGHCVGQLMLGLAMIVLKDRFTSFVPALSKYGSATVGGTLLAIGAVGLYETWAAASESGDGSQAAAVAAAPTPSTDKPGTTGWTLAAGVVYGLQPDALFVIVPALALPSAAAAAAYMVAFVGGTVGAMASYAAAIGTASRAVADATQSTAAVARLSAAASVVAVAAGAAILAAACGVNVPWVSFVTAH